MKYISIIDDDLNGHIFRDDKYHLKIICSLKQETEICLLNKSFKELKKKFKENEKLNFLIKLKDNSFSSRLNLFFNLKIKKNEVIIFNGFNEIDLIFFTLFKFLSQPKIILLPTNNFSKLRFRKYGFLFKIIFLLIKPYIKKIVFASYAEKSFFKKEIPFFNTSKLVDRKMYQIIDQNNKVKNLQSLEGNKNLKNLLFVGPIKKDKPLKPIIDLISEFQSDYFNYYFLNLEKEIDLIKEKFPDLKNIYSMNSQFNKDKNDESIKISNTDYLSAISSADFVFLNHNSDFQYKISGVLMDSLSCHVPFISDDIYPAAEYVRSYINLGVIVNFEDVNWPKLLRNKLVGFKAKNFVIASNEFHKNHTKRDVDFSLENIFKNY